MADKIDFDKDTLNELVAEFSEMLDTVSNELIDLEKDAENNDLLNSIFRCFHNIKGGAGFAKLTHLVELTHHAENLVDDLRRGRAKANKEIIDILLRTVDVVISMVESVKSCDFPEPADDELLTLLKELYIGEESEVATKPAETIDVSKVDDESINELSEDDLEAMFNTIVAEHESKQEDSVEKISKPEQARAKVTSTADKKVLVSEEKSSKVESLVRIDTRLLDKIMNLVGELVLIRNKLNSLASNSPAGDPVAVSVKSLDIITSELQSVVVKTRMQPVKTIFKRFPKVVRDLSRSLGKEINLILDGEETDLDKNLIEELTDPLVHLVRNSIDHGIESCDDRLAKNKSKVGTVRLSAAQEGDNILLRIEDDGAGIDPNKLQQLAIEKDIVSKEVAQDMTDKESYNLIFAPGFSTKTEVSEISGRGVGMDVVRTKISRLRGSIDIDSAIDEGTKFTISFPLTLAILPALMVEICQRTFAITLSSVQEIFHLDMTKMDIVNDRLVVCLRNNTLPLFCPREWLINNKLEQSLRMVAVDDDESYSSVQQTDDENVVDIRAKLKARYGISAQTDAANYGFVVVVKIANRKIGLIVDHLHGQQEVVIKPLGSLLNGTPGISGATINSNGKISLILDVAGLLSHYVGQI